MSNNIKSSIYRLGYHLMAPYGWINDPNGFCYFRNRYHIFFQYYPYAAEWGPMHWGHAWSFDLLHWESLPIALTPGDKYDKDGCYSGSAIVKNDQLYLMYTGHIKEGDYYREVQNLAISTDGIHFKKYANNPVIATPPSTNTSNFRDPFVWEQDGKYYVIIGGEDLQHHGQALLYSSLNLKSWTFLKVLANSVNEKLEGRMWECPNLFYLNGLNVLLCSPQGIESQSEKFLNIHQTGYFLGQLDLLKTNFIRRDFQELDQGHDFYAAQTMLTPDGRRILIGWLNMWHNPMLEQDHGWAGALTLPRELILKDNHIFQNPIAETKYLRQKKIRDLQLNITNFVNICSKQHYFEIDLILINPVDQFFVLTFIDPKTDAEVVLKYHQNHFVLNSSDRPNSRFATIHFEKKLHMQIFVDRSSIEFFLNDGEVVMSERYYFNEAPTVITYCDQPLKLQCLVYQLENQTNSYEILEQ